MCAFSLAAVTSHASDATQRGVYDANANQDAKANSKFTPLLSESGRRVQFLVLQNQNELSFGSCKRKRKEMIYCSSTGGHDLTFSATYAQNSSHLNLLVMARATTLYSFRHFSFAGECSF